MSVRLRYKVTAAVSSTSAEENDLGNLKSEIVDDTSNEGGAWKTTLAPAATEVINLDNIASAKFLALKFVSKDPTLVMTAVNLILNGGSALSVFPVGAAKEAHFLISTTSITSLSLANTATGAVTVDVTICVVGD
jgi:hypothetical protein